MKNYFKKFSVMFIIAFAIMFGNFTNAFAVSHVLSVSYATTVRINDTTISFDKVIYVDPQNGDDITGLGNEKYPYSTIKRALEVCSTKGSAIFLKGTTKETTNPINLASKSVTIIGDYLKYGSKITSSISNGSINIYNVYLSNSSTATYGEIFASIASLNLYNCIFEENSYYTNVSVTSSNFYNCLIIKQGIKYNSIINYVNCAFKAKIATNDTCVSNVTYDDKFKLTSDSGRWQNEGTGKNPDGTVANMGLYGGQFAWGTWTGNKESILLNKSTMILTEDASEQLTATTTPAGVGVTWKSSNESIATVDSNGKVTAIKEGQATITATTSDGLTAICIVTVTKKAEQESISLNKSTTNLIIDDSETLIATTTPAGAQVTWKSSDSSVATVDSAGKVTAAKEGTCTIIATTADGLTAKCVVTVIPKGTDPNPQPIDTEYITNIAHAKGTNTNNPGGEVTIIFHGSSDTKLSLVKTADVKDVWIGDNFTYTLVITNTGTKTAKAVVVKDPAPNHIDFNVNGVTTTQGTVDSSSTSKNIIVNVGDILPGGTVTIKIPSTVIA
ncbi:Ig-like domain-containing protein [Clostridium saccharoperbutylacetonicum]|jgi:uncharacterized repeat protein (TIGR01451 family)|uniref:Ig-like domain-containing protein n=1 Tax=Clostridium saccharoperbutylacetonicum TaxID=36745 RepID=UPI000983A329|nr:Ig-like domain-containing protein [Clostridium saccharoperbutylacetonicum]AQR95207.1 bacterial Ig-like domain protein [Clostridium saccharoperbutylacetonicum]NSB31061.1 putative repeat protein (TIGR01451 family) [Clostridium saccharoperbutylacetonicum]